VRSIGIRDPETVGEKEIRGEKLIEKTSQRAAGSVKRFVRGAVNITSEHK